MYLSGKSKGGDSGSAWTFSLMLLSGVVLGGFLGELLSLLAGAVSWLEFLRWLNYGFDFGLSTPFTLDLGVFTLTFGFTIKFTICGLIGIFAAVLLRKRM